MKVMEEARACWAIYKTHWKKILLMMLIPFIANMILSLPMTFLSIFMQFSTQFFFHEYGLPLLITILVVFALFSILMRAIMFILLGASMACLRDVLLGIYKSPKEVWWNVKKYWRGFLRIFFIMMLFNIIIMGVLGSICAIPIILLVAYGGFEAFASLCFLMILLVIFVIILIIVGVMIGLVNNLAIVIYLTDGCGAWQAVKRSFGIVSSNFRELLKATMFHMLCVLIAAMIPMIGGFVAAAVVNPVFFIFLFYYYSKKGKHPHKYDLQKQNPFFPYPMMPGLPPLEMSHQNYYQEKPRGEEEEKR